MNPSERNHRSTVRKLTAVPRWGLSIITVLIAASMGWTTKWELHCLQPPCISIALEVGSLTYRRHPDHGPLDRRRFYIDKRVWPMVWWPPVDVSSGKWWHIVEVRLWFVLLLASAPTTLLWWRHVRFLHAKRAGLCIYCRYDRAGIGCDARCPECGR